jgi:hypothetical protein
MGNDANHDRGFEPMPFQPGDSWKILFDSSIRNKDMLLVVFILLSRRQG